MRLQEVSKHLVSAGVKHVIVTAMAVRSYKKEGPWLEDIHTMAQCIRRSLKNVPENYSRPHNYQNRQPSVMRVSNYKVSPKPVYEAQLRSLGCPKDVLDKYGDLLIRIEPGTGDARGVFYKPGSAEPEAVIVLTYVGNMVDSTVVDYSTVFRGLSSTIEHELRHFVDYSTGTHKKAMDTLKEDLTFADYYNHEHELDARLTALFVKIAQLFRGSALLAIQKNVVDAMSKSHHDLLKNGKEAFYRFCREYDVKSGQRAMLSNILTKEMQAEAEGKCHEFYEYLRVKYGMALRAVRKEDVTKEMKDAWADLHKASPKKDIDPIKKIASAK
jgi:hypothetical protein